MSPNEKKCTAIVAALDDEIRVIKSIMQQDLAIHVRPALLRVGTYKQNKISLLRTGIGRSATAKAFDLLFSNQSPALVVSTGYCGGADPKDQAGDLIIATAAIDSKTKSEIQIDVKLAEAAAKSCKIAGLRARLGKIVTVDDVVSAPHEKAFMGTEHGVIGIDMESFEVASKCRSAHVPFIIVRAVLDPLDIMLPNVGDAIDESGTTSISGLLNHVIKNPKDILALPRIEYLATQARLSITAFVDTWLASCLSG